MSETEFFEFVADVLDVPVGGLSFETTYASIPAWDSMAQLRLVMELQSRTGVEIPFEDVPNVTSLWELYRRANGLSPKKVVAVDLDGTLWDGVIGEDGVDAIRPKVAFLNELKALKARGVLLTILSKNNLADVRPAFAAGRLAPLVEDDFLFPQVNWEPKADNLRRLARELNFGLGAFVFVDDNPAERLEMRARLPEVAVTAFPPTLAAYFPAGAVTAEDLRKTEEYREEAARRRFLSARATAPSAALDVWRELGCWLDVHALRPEEASRVAQLSQKANQFSVCTNRHAEAEIAALGRSVGTVVYTVHAGDRFGDQGLVAFVIVRDGEILDFTMSCRVAGRGLEARAWAEIVRDLRARGVGTVRATWRRTPKNAPVENLFERLGFSLEAQTPAEKSYVLRDPLWYNMRHEDNEPHDECPNGLTRSCSDATPTSLARGSRASSRLDW